MKNRPMHLGAGRLKHPKGSVTGEHVVIGPEWFYRIANYDRIKPFLMSLASASNHWMFISSEGGLTAGRQSPDSALFPYYTEDKVHDGSDHTGSRTLLRVEKDDRWFLWEPFSRRCKAMYAVTRSLAKNVDGNKLIFEEVNDDLELIFRFSWVSSRTFGFVKHSELVNTSGASVTLEVLDGVENILPWGVEHLFQNQYSSLVDAYKQNELDDETGLATYAFSSIPGDSAEPAEALQATVCWSTCPPETPRLVSSVQLDTFRHGGAVSPERRVCGRRGAYFIHERTQVAAGGQQDWLVVADVGYGACEVASLRRTLATSSGIKNRVVDDVQEETRRLKELVARADGLQRTGDNLASAHHFSNVLFNVMRGGLFESSYSIPVDDLKAFIRAFNPRTFARHESLLDGWNGEIERSRLMDGVRSARDPELERLVTEYLPLSFSRRHGDPSRPWNQFSINVENPDGSRLLDYEGNWRDIFQNWEALALSFPEYVESMICKFVNTTTADGYNPYRIMKSGYEWEAPSPDERWANFGYWGDHQLIYLLKLLELSRSHHPEELERLLVDRRFVYADVPYDIKPYEDLLDDPRASIDYNPERAERIAARVDAVGFDGRYLTDPSGGICRANLAEKLLVPLLAKVCNFVAGAGFWMNTQRPEWNDANNALAGYGVSMVTLFYARRYVSFCLDLFSGMNDQDLSLSAEVASWLEDVVAILQDHRHILEQGDVDAADRKALLDGLGRAAERYRSELYAHGLSGRRTRSSFADATRFFTLTLELFDHTIRLNRRDDGLYHAYNVLGISALGVSVRRLDAMLEGQVAALSSGALTAREAVSVLDALRRSRMYRGDQHSYLLYPERELPRFLDKNTVPRELVERSVLFQTLLRDGNTDLIKRDVSGNVHFHGLVRNVRDVRATLDELRECGYGRLVDAETDLVCEIFESVFDHSRFTGRSGTFYGYEGIGCVYWHMVSKLLLAIQECCVAAAERGDASADDLGCRYYDVRAGLGFNKTPEEYGAFPTDPYSHTPGFAGARQPGMTGQVKEEIITRFGELGLFVRAGRVVFQPVLLRRSEFLSAADTFKYVAVDGSPRALELDSGMLAFTYCQVPIVHRIGHRDEVILRHADGSLRRIDGLTLDRDSSRELFRRTGRVARIDVTLTPGLATVESGETGSEGRGEFST